MSTVVEQQEGPRQTIKSAAAVGVMTVMAWLVLGTGLFAAAFAVMGQLDTAVPVALSPEAPASSTRVVPCVEGWPTDGLSSCEPAAPADVWPGGEPLPLRPAGGMVASINEVAPVPALLGTAPKWIGLIAGGAVVLVLIPVLRSTAAGRLFQSGNARRLAIAAGVIVLAWIAATAGPALAAPTILGLIEAAPRVTEFGEARTFDMPSGWLVFDLGVTWWPLLPALLLAGLAGASRAGTRIITDTEGLV
jgi:hypothetical protein